jgi:hypothetical protein
MRDLYVHCNKKLLQLNNKRTNNQTRKWGIYLNRHLTNIKQAVEVHARNPSTRESEAEDLEV